MNTKTYLRTRMLCEAALMVALAQILSYLKLAEAPNGGSITFAMFPIFFFAIRWGLRPGLMAGFVFGLLQLIFDGAYAWGWQSMLLDYLLGCCGRFIIHYISGVTVYKIVAPTEFLGQTFSSPALYSLIYNGSYMLPNTVISLVMAVVLYFPLKKYILGQDLR